MMQSERVQMPTGTSCQHCGGTIGNVYKRGPHARLDCATCGSYVKFIGKHQLPPDVAKRVFA